MKLDEIAQRYADTLFADRHNTLGKELQAAIRKTVEDFTRRNVFGSGLETSERVKQHLKYIRAAADARLQSYLDAYEKSGTPLEQEDIETIVAQLTSMVGLAISGVKDDPELKSLSRHMEDERMAIIGAMRRRLQLHFDARTLESRRAKPYASLSLHNLFETEFESLREKLGQIEANLSEQIMEAADRLEQGTPEAISHCALTCRKALKAFADAVYPPTDEQPTGRVLDDAHFVNRLWKFSCDRLQDKSRRSLVELSLKSLDKRVDRLNKLASKDVHSTSAQREAERCLIQTVFLLSELSEL